MNTVTTPTSTSSNSSANPAEPDVLTARTKAIWTSGDFGKIATSYTSGAAEFIYRLRLLPGDRVLDVACGTGNLSIPAARTGARVTGIDIAANLLEQAREWALSEGHDIQFEEGNAEQMPYADASFDAAVTMFGVMFAPRPDVAAAELTRVVRPGGRIAMANWMPDGFIGGMLKIVAKYVPPPPTVPSPLLWGVEAKVAERLGGEVADLRCAPRMITLSFPFDAATTVDAFLTYYGPTLRAYTSLGPDAQAAFRSDIVAYWQQHNRAQDGTTAVDSAYLEVVATRK